MTAALDALLDVLPDDAWLTPDALAERAVAAGLPMDRSADTYDGHPFTSTIRHLRRRGLIRTHDGTCQRARPSRNSDAAPNPEGHPHR